VRWEKRGHIYVPDGSRWWARRNASFPTVQSIGDALRVYFAALDDDNFGRTMYVDLDPDDPSTVVHQAEAPVLDIGELGAFDDSGATVFSVVDDGARTRLYYQGWQRAERVPYLIFTGLATRGHDDGGAQKHSRTPILDRNEDDPFLRGAPFVLRDGEGFRMWYVSARRWVRDEHGVHYDIVIKHARSADGVSWDADPEPCLTPDDDGEYAVGRPCVLHEDGIYRMWYSIRSFQEPYRIGYAESGDGLRWTRRDAEAGIARSDHGWDSEMICYAYVVRVRGRLLMFYNGNQHGRSGFGYAEAV
jgi:predicted GH43/DUF377 family glycosyl hydrolase